MYCKIKTIPIIFLALTSIIMGDNRSYVWTYEYKTTKQDQYYISHVYPFILLLLIFILIINAIESHYK